uniref:Ubiquitin carboxyl-terminal hydrolase n=2 Tax=Mesocestoides corti TaxID=53468 RepID=A0A5K3F1S8_MESCO
MMTLTMQSAVYQQPNSCSSFNDTHIGQDKIIQKQELLNGGSQKSPMQSCSVQSRGIPTASLNAAISSSLKLNNFNCSAPQSDSSLNLLNNVVSFHPSPAMPLDSLIKSRIENMPNSTVLVNKSWVKNTGTNGKVQLFPDSELLKCCKNSQSALPRVNLGLRNAGNTCYLNSVLQCLLATGSLLHFINEKHNKPGVCVYANGKNGRRFCALCALFRLFQEHGQQNNHSLMSQSMDFSNRTSFGSTTPSVFAANVRAVCPNLRVYAQEDAHEYLLGLLSRMEDSVLTGVGKVPRSALDTNVIRRIFGGITRSEVTCTFCHKVSPRNDQWFNLSMDITYARSLQQCLVSFTQTEILQGANAYKCETCKQLRHARRSSRIYRAPPILIVQFNRFSRSHKLDYRVEFPASFNMRPHMTPSSGAPVVYHLYATLNHEGFSCRSGHYIAFTKRRNQWLSHNDSVVTSTTQEHVLRQSPYLLFYQLASPEDVMTPSQGDCPISPANNRPSATNVSSAVPPAASTTPPFQSDSSGRVPSTACDLDQIPLPSGSAAPVKSRPSITFHPRVLAKPSPIPSKSPTVAPGAKAPEARVNTNGDSFTGRVAAITAGKPSSPEPTATPGSRPQQQTPATANATSPGERNANSPLLTTNGEVTISRQKSPPPPSLTLVNGRCQSSSDSASTESSSVEWVPVTKADLLTRKRCYKDLTNNTNDEGSGVPWSEKKRLKWTSAEAASDYHKAHHKKHRHHKRRRDKHRHKKKRRHDFGSSQKQQSERHMRGNLP